MKKNNKEQILSEEELELEAKKTKKRKLISNLIFVLVLTILVVVLFCSLGEISDIKDTFLEIGQSNNWVWLLVALVLTLCYFFLYPLSLCFFAKASDSNAKFSDSYLIGCSEHLYNGITPFAAGGQPFQIYSYTKCNDQTGKATGVVLVNFVTFMIVTNVFAIISLIYYPYYVEAMDAKGLEWLQYVAIAGFAINFLTLLLLIVLGTSKWVRNLFVKILTKLCHFKWINKLAGDKIPEFTHYCDNAQLAFKQLWVHRKTFIFSFLIKFITMAVFYSIPFFLLLSVGIKITGDQFFLVLFATSFAITSVVWMPTPGGTGGIEYAFAIIIASVILIDQSNASAEAVSLLWRMFTYYFILLLSFSAGAIFEAIISARLKKDAKLKREKAHDIHIEHESSCETIKEIE